MDPATLISAAKSAQAIVNFVSGSGLKEAIATIMGDIHLDAARLALDTSKVVNSKTDRINSVLTHLEAAHVAFARIHGRASKPLVGMYDFQSVKNAVAKDVWVCCIAALCFASLNEYRAVEKYLLLGDEAYNKLKFDRTDTNAHPLNLPGKLLFLANVRNWDIQGDIMSADMYSDFKSAIRARRNT